MHHRLRELKSVMKFYVMQSIGDVLIPTVHLAFGGIKEDLLKF